MKTVMIVISDEDYDAMISHLAKDRPGCRTVAVLPQSAKHNFLAIREKQQDDSMREQAENSFSDWYQDASTSNAANWNKEQ